MPAKTVRADPSKTFFVRMLTRDISLDDCILDLVDNSIDAARSKVGGHQAALKLDESLKGYEIDIKIAAQSFSISDNCGGLSREAAEQEAFTFGRFDDQETEDYAVGVYGIGMKRAVFKMGRDIHVSSTYTDAGTLKSFVVPIKVSEWLGKKAWNFPIESAAPGARAGVIIEVIDLLEETRAKFADASYIRGLTRSLAREYMISLLRGLIIRLNGREVRARPIELASSKSFMPLRRSYKDGDVSIEIVAGMAELPPDALEPDEKSRVDELSGWYVFCNERAVLTSDRTAATGWGTISGTTRVPAWHRQYGGFVGLIFFSSKNPELLPMTTTKRNVDLSSTMYMRALEEMRRPTRDWIDYTNRRKSNSAAVKALERVAPFIRMFDVRARNSLGLPPVDKPARTIQDRQVTYRVPLKRLHSLASKLGDINMEPRDVGIASFNYTYKSYVGSDEDD